MVLVPGDLVGEGCLLQGETIRPVFSGVLPVTSALEPATKFKIGHILRRGVHDVVYLAREVLTPPSAHQQEHFSIFGLDNRSSNPTEIPYAREYTIKCLFKGDPDSDELAKQMSEARIHQSLRPHPNIVTLYRALETSQFLLLPSEYVLGQDLSSFMAERSFSQTPSATVYSQPRLRLVSSMFSQMCEAVAACHDQQVFHRNLKPENFIVHDERLIPGKDRYQLKVDIKLTGFDLSTTDLSSSDMDCGSVPYMSYECRNNVAATYRPRAADVWSLGIVLINMLYHSNPWTDTADGACASFSLYRKNPVDFLYRFTGMTQPVAEYLASNVFCILEDPEDDSQRVTANEFGAWSRNLPILLGSLAHSPPTLQLSDVLPPASAFKNPDRSTIFDPESGPTFTRGRPRSLLTLPKISSTASAKSPSLLYYGPSIPDMTKQPGTHEVLNLTSECPSDARDHTAVVTYPGRGGPVRQTDTHSQSEKSQGSIACHTTPSPPFPTSFGQCAATRCITANRALLHVSRIEPLLVETLTHFRYGGRYKVQVGFNELMLEEGLRVEEIYVILERAFHAVAASDICSAFEPVFGPFPGIVSSPDETYHITVDRLPLAISHSAESGLCPILSCRDGEADAPYVENDQGSKKAGENNRDVKRGKGGGDNDGRSNRSGGSGGPGRLGGGGGGGGGDGGGGGGGGSGDNKASHRGGRRVLNIPGFGSTLTLKGPDGSHPSHQFNAIGGLDIIVDQNYQAKSPPPDSRWSGPWFEVDMTKLEVNVDQPAYLFSLIQVRVTATSYPKPTSLRHAPVTSPFATDIVKMTDGKSRFLNVGGSIGMNPAVQVSGSFGGTSALESNHRRWAIESHTVMNSTEGNESESIFWRFTHNDIAYKSERLQRWSFARELLPSALYAFSRAPVLEMELMVFWSEVLGARHAKQRAFFPSRGAEASSHIFANFIYQVSVKVDLNDIQEDHSWIMGGDAADDSTWDELRAAQQGTVHLAAVEKFTERHSDQDPGSTAPTDCQVILQRAIEGRVTLTEQERNGVLPLTLQTPNSIAMSSAQGVLTPALSPSPPPSLAQDENRPPDPASQTRAPKKRLKLKSIGKWRL